MTLFEIGRLCMKIAGRDAGRKCAVVERVDDHFVVIDGNVRRKRVNIKHLEPLADVIKVKENASHADVQKAFEALGLSVWQTNARKTTERPRVQRKAVKAVQRSSEGETSEKKKTPPKKMKSKKSEDGQERSA